MGRLLFPPLCPVTGEPVAEAGRLSAAGWSQLNRLSAPCCERCGAPFDHEDAAALCASCAAPDQFPRNLCSKNRLDGLRAALRYDAESAKLVLALKYGDRHDFLPALAGLLAQAVRDLDPPSGFFLVPVPLHPGRLRQRRFNQAAVLALTLAPLVDAPVAAQALRRRKATPQQKGLGFERRYRNLIGAFEADPFVKDLDFVVVDDVLTSGATLVGCARALKKAGAKSVRAVTIARAFPDTKDPQVDLPEI